MSVIFIPTYSHTHTHTPTSTHTYICKYIRDIENEILNALKKNARTFSINFYELSLICISGTVKCQF